MATGLVRAFQPRCVRREDVAAGQNADQRMRRLMADDDQAADVLRHHVVGGLAQ